MTLEELIKFLEERRPRRPKPTPGPNRFENHPFFVKKLEEAKAFLAKHPFPENL